MGIIYNVVRKQQLQWASFVVCSTSIPLSLGNGIYWGIPLPQILVLQLADYLSFYPPAFGEYTTLINEHIPSPCFGDDHATKLNTLKLSLWWGYWVRNSLTPRLEVAGCMPGDVGVTVQRAA